MILWYYYILELTTIFVDDIDIQGDSLCTRIYRILLTRRVALVYFCVKIFIKSTFLGLSQNKNMYGTMILLSIRTNHYYCCWYWCTSRLLTSIYRIISSKRVRKNFNDNFLYFFKLYDKNYNITHTVWKPGTREWRLSAARVELRAI